MSLRFLQEYMGDDIEEKGSLKNSNQIQGIHLFGSFGTNRFYENGPDWSYDIGRKIA